MDSRIRIDDESAAKLKNLAALCVEVPEEARLFGNRTRWLPQPGSPYEWERVAARRKLGPKGDWDDAPIRGITSLTGLMLPVIGQYILGMSALLEKYEVIFPLAPVARSVFELAGRITWLLDPRIEARDRAARYSLLLIDDITRAKTLAHAFGDLKQESKLGELLHQTRKIEVARRFYPSEMERNKSGSLILRGQHLPGLHDSVRILDEVQGEAWNAGGLYVFLSASSHPTVRVILEMIDQQGIKNLEASGEPSDPAETFELNFRLPDLYYPITLTRNALLTYIKTWCLIASYHGLDTTAANNLAQRVDSATNA